MKENYEELIKGHNTFGGYICESDFDTSTVGKHRNKSYMAERISKDMRFDATCKRNYELRKAGIKICA